jgi:hypothetical protein
MMSIGELVKGWGKIASRCCHRGDREIKSHFGGRGEVVD